VEESTTIRADMKAGIPRVLRLARVLLVAAVVLYVLSGIYVVQPDERGVVLRFGRVVADGVKPGIHYRLPWPFESSVRPQVTAIKRMSVGYRIVDRLQGIPPTAREAQFLTGDTNIIEIQLLVQYVVKDPSDYLYNVEEPHWLVRKACESALTEKVAGLGVDEILTTRKIEIAQAVKDGAQQVLDSYGTGIQLVAAHLQEVTPPREVADAFREVASAREDKNRIIHEATGYGNRIVPTARGEGRQLVTRAEGYRSEKVDMAEGEAGRFAALLSEYRRAPGAARDRIYVEVMEDVLPTTRMYLVDEKTGDGALDLRFLAPKR